MASSPTARTLGLLRREGYAAGVVERRLPGCFRSVDLFNAFDLVAVRPDAPGVLGVQCTSAGNHAARVRKLRDVPEVRLWLLAGNRAEVWSWGKRKGRWCCRRQALTLEDTCARGEVPPA